MSEESAYVDPAEREWRDTPYVGVTFKKLRHDKTSGGSAVLVKFEPGAKYGAHRHPGGEEYLVLSGSLEDGGRTWGPGTYVHHPPGSAHRPTSKEGCVLFITLPQPVEILGEAECRELLGRS
jgi:anti-sigma factor ChrR (cupin superfamily)